MFFRWMLSSYPMETEYLMVCCDAEVRVLQTRRWAFGEFAEIFPSAMAASGVLAWGLEAVANKRRVMSVGGASGI